MASTSFPVGRRVLVVDADHKSLKLLKTTLRKCDYQVTTTNLAQEALDILPQGFDIVICDVNITDMDAYQFVPHVLKLDLPVILMSVDGEDSSSAVLKGVQHGACDYLIKPIRQKEVQYIWQHVVRKRMGVVEGQENENLGDEIRKNGDGSDGQQLGVICGKKRKSIDGSVKKKKQGQRVVWTEELHERFLRAVEILGGLDKAGPKAILELMAVAGLTRENVASHLQKYRISKSREEKGELKAVVNLSPIDLQRFYNTTPSPIFEEGDVVGSSRIRPIEGQSESKLKLHTCTNGPPPLNDQSCVIATENTLFSQPNLTNSHSLNTNPATMKNLQLNGYFNLKFSVLPAADFNFGPTYQELVIDDHMYSWPNFGVDSEMTTIKDNVLSDHIPYYPR